MSTPIVVLLSAWVAVAFGLAALWSVIWAQWKKYRNRGVYREIDERRRLRAERRAQRLAGTLSRAP
jgi:hypothetical protein